MVKDNQRGGLAEVECRFQEAGGVFDAVARVHRGINGEVAFQQPPQGPLAEFFQTAGR
jgi:hypothetical protein